MAIQTRQVTVNIFDNDGSVIDNARVLIRLVGLGNEPGGAVSQGEQVKHTDENGVAVFTLWENNGTYSNTYYEVQSWHPDRGNQIHRRERFLVPDHDADLEDLIAFGLAGVDPNLALLEEMQDIFAQTNSAAQSAQGSANLSQESADDAAGFAANSQTSALNSAASATASANSATSAAGSASSAATNATSASTSATQAATSATSAASSATAAGTSATSANAAATTAAGHSTSAAGSAAAAAGSAAASEVSATAANSFSNSASSFANESQSYSLDAQNHAVDANSSKNDAETAATAAAGSAATAAGSAIAANNSASLAQNWANEDEDVVVSGGEYSAKHYAAKASAAAINSYLTGLTSKPAGFPNEFDTVLVAFQKLTDFTQGSIGALHVDNVPDLNTTEIEDFEVQFTRVGRTITMSGAVTFTAALSAGANILIGTCNPESFLPNISLTPMNPKSVDPAAHLPLIRNGKIHGLFSIGDAGSSIEMRIQIIEAVSIGWQMSFNGSYVRA